MRAVIVCPIMILMTTTTTAKFAVGDRVNLNHRNYFVVAVDLDQPSIAYWLDDDRDGIGVLYALERHVHRA